MSVDFLGTGNIGPKDAKYIVQQGHAGLTAEQILADLITGLVKNTTGTGVLSIAVEGTDYWKPGGTDVAIADGGTGASTALAGFNNLSPLTTKGDILSHNGSNNVRVPVGADGLAIIADSAETAGWRWGSVSSFVATNFRDAMHVRQTATSTLAVNPGILEVNGNKITKTSATTLTLSTASDWAGGSSLRATNTTGYVGVDSAGNIKLHTTAPSHFDYALTITAGKKRYASWSSTTYRIIGWFRMNGTGSGELDSFGVSNILEAGVSNVVRRKYTAQSSISINSAGIEDDTIPQSSELTELMRVGFVKSNPNSVIRVTTLAHLAHNTSGANHHCGIFKDSATDAIYCQYVLNVNGSGVQQSGAYVGFDRQGDTELTYFELHARYGIDTGGNTTYFNGNSSGRLFGGVQESFIEIEELETLRT